MRDLGTGCGASAGRLVVPGDPEWPAGLADLGEASPFCLWVRGPLRPRRGRRAVRVRWSAPGRRPAYGEHVATAIGAGCAERGLCVVSGAAYGIDGAAHRGALAVGGTTVAVLACGVDRAYPRGHERLIARIAARGVRWSARSPPGRRPPGDGSSSATG